MVNFTNATNNSLANTFSQNLNTTENGSLILNEVDVLDQSSDDYYFYYEGDISNLQKPWIHEPHFIPTVAVYGTAFLIGLIGNSLVIFAMLGDRKSRSVTASFMVSLAVADLLYLIVCVPFETSRYFIGHWEIGPFLCKLSGTVEMLSALASIMNLTAVSIERYIVIVHPIMARSWCTLGNTKKILPLVWVLAVALSSPTFHVMDTEKSVYYNNQTSVAVIFCADIGINMEERLIFSVYQFVAMFAAPTLIMIFCYAFVIHALWVSSRQLINMTETSSSSSKHTLLSPDTCSNRRSSPNEQSLPCHIRSRRSLVHKAKREHSVEVLRARKQVIKMLIMIIVVFLICWAPKLIFRMLQRMDKLNLFQKSIFTTKILIDCLPYIQSCLNPIIYGFMSRNFRRSMQSACKTHVCRKAKTQTCLGRPHPGSDYELEPRSTCTNGTIQTKISLRTSKSSSSEDRTTVCQ